MAAPKTSRLDGTQPGTQVSEETVQKVGTAVGKVAMIQQAYAHRLESETAPAARQALTAQVQQEAVNAIDAEGVSVDDYNAVLTMAEGDPALEQRLLDAARTVL